MMSFEEKLRALNRILASRSKDFSEKFLESSRAIDFALSTSSQFRPISEFAKSILKIYDENAALEFVDIASDYFDPIFVIGEISEAVKRLSGYESPILVVAGLERSSKDGAARMSQKKREQYFENLNVVEDFVLRYKSCLPQIEIIFI